MKHHLIAATVLVAALPASANLLANGSFENPNIVATGGYALYATGSTAITGWTVQGADTQLTPDTYAGLKAADGRQWLDLTGIYGYDKGVRSDAVAVEVGKVYDISFDVGNYLPFGRSTLGVSINGAADQIFSNTSLGVTGHYPMNWAHFSIQWTADAPTLQLTFLGRANGALSNNAVIGLDNVAVDRVQQPVPEPGTWALMLGGLALMGAYAGRSNRRR
ncbi:MAG: PEP-CTERM sorting domain-containing protein [Aquabacterium sp.]